jgi:hypothetical protein
LFACGKLGPCLLVESRLADRHLADYVVETALTMPFGRQTFDRHGYGQQKSLLFDMSLHMLWRQNFCLSAKWLSIKRRGASNCSLPTKNKFRVKKKFYKL